MSFIEQIPTYLWYAFQIFIFGYFAFWGVLGFTWKRYEEGGMGMRSNLGQLILIMLIGLLVIGCLPIIGIDISLESLE